MSKPCSAAATQQGALRRVAAELPLAGGRPAGRRVVAVGQGLDQGGQGRIVAGADRNAIDLGLAGQQMRDPHPALGQRPGLVGADDVGRPEGLDGCEPLDERAPLGHPPDADGERERDRRQQSLRNVGDEQADREGEGVVERKPGDRGADQQEHQAGGDGDQRDQLGGGVDLLLKRAELGAHPLRERRDPAELSRHPGREDDSGRLAGRAETCR